MFSYLKYFFLGSLVLIITAASFFTLLYKENVQEILHTQNIHNSSAIATGFENAIYNKKFNMKSFYNEELLKRVYGEANYEKLTSTPGETKPMSYKDKSKIEYLYSENFFSEKLGPVVFDMLFSKTIDQSDAINKLIEITPEERSTEIAYNDLFMDANDYFSKMPIISAGFYTTKQELLFFYPYEESEKTTIAKTVRKMGSIGVTSPVSFTNSENEIIENVDYISVDGQKKNGPILHYVKPVFDKTGKAIGAVEIFSEMSDASDELNELQYIGGLFIVSLFVLLLSGLYWIVRRAEKIIEKQYDVNMELQSAKVAAESENEQKSQFLANISHELRTPLNAIIGFSEIMKDEILGAIGNPQYKNYVMDIHTQGVHLLSLINDILDFSKAEAGKLDLEYEEIDLNKLIKAAIRTQEPRAQTAEVGLFDDLPVTHIIMQTDAKRLKQIMLNLLSNAVKFTPPQGRVAVAAWESAVDGKVCIEVSDTGIGIAAKDIAKALAPFGQVDSELSRRYEGTGLGLPLTKKFIELLGGSMNLESEVGKGTRITVILPKEKPDGKTPTTTATPAQPDGPMPKGGGPEGSGGRKFFSFQKPKE